MKLEEKLKQLEDTAEKLDNKNISLEEAIALYEGGVKLIRECMDSLNESKGKIESIRGELKEMLSRAEGENN